MKVLVTGATGFVGSYLVKTLLDKGIEVAGAVRPGSPVAMRLKGAEYVSIEDPYSPEAWGNLLGKADAVVHLIGKTHSSDIDDKAALPIYRKINVGITEALLEASRRRGVNRFVYLSSIKAVGEGKDSPYSEDSPCRPEDVYGISKREAELLILDTPGVQSIILRPPLIYGPGVKGNFLKILNAVSRGVPLPFDSLNNARSMLYVGNLADAISCCLISGLGDQKVFHVADANPVSTKRLVQEIARGLGKKAFLFPFPTSLLMGLGRLAGKKVQVGKLVGSLVVSTEMIQKDLGWVPKFTFSEGINATCAWFSSKTSEATK